MLNRIINLLFPEKCIFCGEILKKKSDGISICNRCFSSISFIPKTFYNTNTKFKYELYFEKVICACEYTGIVKKAILRYKFFGKSNYYKTFSNLLFNSIKKIVNEECIDAIISVPLNKNRELDRGYNQAKLISKQLSKKLMIPEMSRCLVRVKNTKSQSLLNKRERKLNVKGAFQVRSFLNIKGKTILLIDDILTTGFTLNECSRVLKEAGVNKIIVAVVASGINL